MRVIVAAHAQSTANRAIRELGRSGAWVLVVFLLVIGTTFLAPLWAAMLGLGFVLGKSLESGSATPAIIALLGGLLFGMSYFGGATSGTISGAKQLTWEAYRTYPVRLRSVFLAELAASAVDLMPMVLGISTAALCLGLGIANVALVPLLPFVLVEGVLGALVVQLLVGTLAERLVRRLRVALSVLALVLGVGIVLGALAGTVPEGDPVTTALGALARLRAPLEHAAIVLPTTWTARSLAALARGQVLEACLDHLVPIAALVVLALIAARMLERDASQPAIADGPTERLWSFRSAAAGIARLQLRTVVDSRVGRFGLVFPLVVVVLVRGPLTLLFGRAPWAVPAAFIYVALLGTQFQLNQFGLDGHGTKALLLLPIDEIDLWRGKARGLLAYQSLQAISLGLFLMVVQRPSAVEMVSGVLVFFGMVSVENTVGRVTSVVVPRMLPRKRMQSNASPIGLVLVALSLSLGFGGTVGTAFALLAHRAPAWRPVMAGGLLTSALILQHVLLPGAVTRLRRRKETLLAALG